jgi:aryl-alcohol dehydrogenase-like predicted oxidoreductase
MQAGLLTGTMSKERVATLPSNDWRIRNVQYQEPNLTRNLAKAEILKEIAARHGRSAGEVAVAWVLRHPAITAAIVGFRNPKQVDGVIGAMTFRLTQDEIDEIESQVQALA